NETNWSGAQRRGPDGTRAVATETARNSADESAREPVNRSLDHVSGFESLPPSQIIHSITTVSSALRSIPIDWFSAHVICCGIVRPQPIDNQSVRRPTPGPMRIAMRHE